MHDFEKKGCQTRIIHAGHRPDPATGAVSTPIYQSSTFAFKSADHGAASFRGDPDGGFIYTRLGNPTIMALEESLAILEKGCGAMACATGMAAVNLVYYALLSQGDHVVCTESLYGPSRMVLETEYPRFGIAATFVDSADAHNVAAAMTPATKLVYLETPANPTLKLADLTAIAAIAHRHGALVCVDNTFASPYLQNPLELGADLVLHSMTKFINGHSDVVAGMVVVKDRDLHKRLLKVHRNLGGTMDPHQAWLVQRGIKTLGLRMDRAQDNCLKLAHFLEKHPKIAWVRYPFLASHPQYDLARRQMRGGGAVMSFGVKGGLAAGKKLMDNLDLCTLAVSLGGIETLIEHPASMTHAGIPEADRRAAAITDDLVRIAVGCEDYADLEADLARVLATI
ncbi:MAG TPA: PLP-dependent aspartate aminotransferase family protein [Candidatus Krumholzibacteria bacterium]|nr:PLP-dependent aspartate aminotransferase family protein [Candidatus Krumholzibacteria bacterium]HPD70800.1 PLP-dependent aspartate aminotransferase family protein [Candidatus Krumholzibacteria bacterium]HRY39500.1 PLP-dependent aspartate aminotransferase family protein [Candidatus Krumholzibacteria bacterium]